MLDTAATAFIKFTPISGCRQDQAPACYLLEIDQARILLDCGSTATLDVRHLHALKKIVGKQRLDAVVLSHASLRYCGGLPYVYGVLGVQCPVLATTPVHHLGLVSLYDAYQSFQLTNGAAPADTSLDHIDRAFEHVTLLRYAQSFYLAHSSITVSALPAGHTVGGAIWRFRKGDETVVYAPSLNHKRETILDGAPFELLARPTLLITGAEQALQVAVARKTRDDALFEAIGAAVKANGNVLIPVDTASRSLELIQLLEGHWAASRTRPSLALLTHQSKRTVDYAQGLLEWMGQAMMKGFETERRNPFELRHVRLCHSLAEVAALPEPRVVLASGDTLDTGFSRALFASIASQSKSTLLFLGTPAPGTLAHRLLHDAAKAPKVALKIFEHVPLDGEELRAHHRAEEEERERVAAEAAFEELKRRRQEEDGLEAAFSGDEGEDPAGSAENVAEIDKINSAKALREIYWTDYRHDWYVDAAELEELAEALEYPLASQAQALATGGLGRHQVYPFQFAKRRATDYGVPVDPREFAAEAPARPEAPEAKAAREPRAEEAKRVPTKLIDYTKEITARCQRRHMDFSGLTDGRSLKTIIGQIEPKRLIFIGAADDPSDYLTSHFQFIRSTPADTEDGFECRAPRLHETVRISVASNTIPAFMTQGIIEQLNTALFKDIELAYVSAKVELRADRQEADTDAAMDIDSVAGPPDASTAMILTVSDDGPYARARRPLLVGDPKLNELRALLAGRLAIAADFVAGDLVLAGGRVRLRKEDDRLVLEGPATPVYYSIRDLLYSQFAIV